LVAIRTFQQSGDLCPVAATLQALVVVGDSDHPVLGTEGDIARDVLCVLRRARSGGIHLRRAGLSVDNLVVLDRLAVNLLRS